LQDLDFAPLYGADLSRNSLAICRELCPGARLLEIAGDTDATGSGFRLPPIADGSLQVVVIWGVFHYNSEATIQAMLTEICRMLRPDGLCLGTLRAVGDTHFHDNPDMAGATLRLFDESGTRKLLGAHFSEVRLGYAERSPVGELERRVCHWIFRAGKRGAGPESRTSL
jgi:SAM-dependent methyltransferase